jgi:hypothetical protein
MIFLAPCVAVEEKCQGLLFSDSVSIAPKYTNFIGRNTPQL